MFLQRRLEGDTRHFIPNSFLRRAVQHLERTGEPLLYRRLPSYTHTLEAWPDGDGYTLNVPRDEWEPPFLTWREYAAHRGYSTEEVMEEQGFESPDELDSEIEIDILDQLVTPEESIEGAAEALLDDLPQYQIEDAGELEPYVTDLVVEIYENDGQYPGDPWTGSTQVCVPSKLGLSILQYVLDELGKSVEIELMRP